MQDTEMQKEYAANAASKPSLLLMGEAPRLIDEWQNAPVLWHAVRTMVDKRQVPGQFILIGSTVVDRSKVRHFGTGRISRMKMLPMSLWESGESNGKISVIVPIETMNPINAKCVQLTRAARICSWP